MFGVHEHVGGQVAQPKVNDIAVFPHGRDQEAELISQVGEGISQEEPTSRSGRQLGSSRGSYRHGGSLFLS